MDDTNDMTHHGSCQRQDLSLSSKKQMRFSDFFCTSCSTHCKGAGGAHCRRGSTVATTDRGPALAAPRPSVSMTRVGAPLLSHPHCRGPLIAAHCKRAWRGPLSRPDCSLSRPYKAAHCRGPMSRPHARGPAPTVAAH